jgi:two-component system sensor histidine kinase AlgZ
VLLDVVLDVLRGSAARNIMSIKQNATTDALPDFRNLGVMARVLVGVNVAAFAAASYAQSGWAQIVDRFVHDAVLVEPALIVTLMMLYVLAPWLRRLAGSAGYAAGYAAVAVIALALVTLVAYAVRGLAPPDPAIDLPKLWMFTLLVSAALLEYLRLRARAFSPALIEARLQALQARIRPHFLFNSLNAVLSLIRRDPRRAETALEDLSDLFRTLVSDQRGFVRLADEIALLERYARLEQLRLGERLRVVWEIDAAPLDALLPPLVLQPLLENAVYHGVEPGTGPGEVAVHVALQGDRVRLRLTNPYHREHQHRAGNHMALDNIRERLMLFFDAEARLGTRVEAERYVVEIEIPYITERADQRADSP